MIMRSSVPCGMLSLPSLLSLGCLAMSGDYAPARFRLSRGRGSILGNLDELLADLPGALRNGVTPRPTVRSWPVAAVGNERLNVSVARKRPFVSRIAT